MKKLRGKSYSEQRVYGKDDFIEALIAMSVGFSTLFFIIALFVAVGAMSIPGNFLTAVDFFVFGVLVIIGPVSFYDHIKQKRKREILNYLPEFLRDVANSTSSGMTIFDAVRSASEGEYGHLTSELKIIASQLSWGIPMKQAFNNFGNRINTPITQRLVIIINKALEVGGNTSSVFHAAAKELDQIKRVEQQRRTEMSMYSIVIFISFFVFLAVILIINTTIFAAIYDLQGKMAGKSVGGLAISQIDPEAVTAMFFVFVFVQSLGGGMLGGFMTEGRLSSGVRYGFMLVMVSFVVFKLFF